MLGVLAFKKNSTVLAKDELEKLTFRPLEILCFGLCPDGYFSPRFFIFFQFKARFQRSWWRPLSRRMPTSSKLTTQNFGSISRREISKKFVKVKNLSKKLPSDSSDAKILVKQGSLLEGEGSVQLTSLN
jgi:hypothetical protein